MGRQLARLAAAALITAAAPAAAEPTAADLVKQGLAAYKAGDYEAAISALERANAMAPSPDTQFALAQAERLAGHCDKAVPLYKQLIASNTDPDTGKLIAASLAQCPEEPVKPIQVEAPPPVVVPPEPPRAPPPPVAHTDTTNVALIAGAGIAAGVSFGLLLASIGSSNDASTAQLFTDNVAISNRASAEMTASAITAGAAVGLAAIAVLRIRHQHHRTEVSLARTGHGGGAVVLSGQW